MQPYASCSATANANAAIMHTKATVAPLSIVNKPRIPAKMTAASASSKRGGYCASVSRCEEIEPSQTLRRIAHPRLYPRHPFWRRRPITSTDTLGAASASEVFFSTSPRSLHVTYVHLHGYTSIPLVSERQIMHAGILDSSSADVSSHYSTKKKMACASRNAIRLSSLYGVDISRVPRVYGCTTVAELASYLESGDARVRNSHVCMPLFSLAPGTCVRPYQAECARLARSRSGFVVAPCGSGKTLIGLLVCAMNGGRFLIVTTRYADQWATAIKTYMQPVGDVKVRCCTDFDAGNLSPEEMPHVVITTYGQLCARRKTTVSKLLHNLPFVTAVYDEAHSAASKEAMRCHEKFPVRAAHTILLTATKVREDDELKKVEAVHGGVLATVDRRKLVQEGYVADVKSLNLLVSYEPSLEAWLGREKAKALHPNKMRLLCSCLRRLCGVEKRKALVFCDCLFCLDFSSRICASQDAALVIGAISMQTPAATREELLHRFTECTEPCTLFLSRTGDEALDIPAASAGVVFGNFCASRRQIVQRMGRLTRYEGGAAMFIVLVANEEEELKRCEHRNMYVEENHFIVETLAQADSVYGTSMKGNSRKYVTALKLAWAEWKE